MGCGGCCESCELREGGEGEEEVATAAACVGVCCEEELWDVLTEILSSISPTTAFFKTSTHLYT